VGKELHKAFESIVRLKIMSVLMVNERFDFLSLREMLEITDGNLASHLKTLENLEFIQTIKSFTGRKPRTQYSATKIGKDAFEDHLRALENLIKEHS